MFCVWRNGNTQRTRLFTALCSAVSYPEGKDRAYLGIFFVIPVRHWGEGARASQVERWSALSECFSFGRRPWARDDRRSRRARSHSEELTRRQGSEDASLVRQKREIRGVSRGFLCYPDSRGISVQKH